MPYVYILESEKTGRYYIGCSHDVEERLKKHNMGMVEATRKFRPFQLKLKQEFQNLTEARQIEVRLKKLKRKDYIRKAIENQNIQFWATSSSGRATDS